jgi:hypothetical protein
MKFNYTKWRYLDNNICVSKKDATYWFKQFKWFITEGKQTNCLNFERCTSHRQQLNPAFISDTVCILTFPIFLQSLVFSTCSNANREWQLHNTLISEEIRNKKINANRYRGRKGYKDIVSKNSPYRFRHSWNYGRVSCRFWLLALLDFWSQLDVRQCTNHTT